MDALANAELVNAEPYAPQKPIVRLEAIIRESNQRQIGIVLPAVTPRVVELLADATESNSADHDLLLTGDGVEYFWTALELRTERLRQQSNFGLWRLPGDVEVGLAVVEDVGARVDVYSDAGNVRGAFVFDDPAAVTAVTERFASLRQRSRRVDCVEVRE